MDARLALWSAAVMLCAALLLIGCGEDEPTDTPPRDQPPEAEADQPEPDQADQTREHDESASETPAGGQNLFGGFGAARERARRTASATQLRTIGTAVYMYANDWEDHLPESLGSLVANDYGVDAELFANPRRGRQPQPPADLEGAALGEWVDANSHYAYTRPAEQLNQVDDSSSRILAYEKITPDLADGINVLFVDGSVKFLDFAEAARAMREQGIEVGEHPEIP